MENGRYVRDMRDPFDIFGGLGTFGGFTSSIFGRKPFNDPFFTRPFGNISKQATPQNEPPSGPIPKGPIIHELNSDDEIEEEQENKGDKEPFVDHPDEESEIGDSENVSHRIDFNKAEGTPARTYQFHSCKVTYGGVDGAYYTSSTTRRMGDDGVLMEECREADKSTGEAKHRVSKGVHNKGHSLTRKLNSDGKVETMQTLHNLNKDELENFENSWRGNPGRYLPWIRNSSTAFTGSGFGTEQSNKAANSSNRAQPKKVVRINIE